MYKCLIDPSDHISPTLLLVPALSPDNPSTKICKNRRLQYRSLQEHLPGVLNVLLDLDQESDSFPSVKQSVVVCERKVHHRPNLDLSVDSDRLLLDGVQTKHSGLGKVDNGSAHQTAKD